MLVSLLSRTRGLSEKNRLAFSSTAFHLRRRSQVAQLSLGVVSGFGQADILLEVDLAKNGRRFGHRLVSDGFVQPPGLSGKECLATSGCVSLRIWTREWLRFS